MIKRFLSALFISMVCLCFAPRAQAQDAGWSLETTREGKTNEKKNFNLNQQPYGYLFIDNDFFKTAPRKLDITWQWFYLGADGKEKEAQEKYLRLAWDSGLNKDGDFQMWESPDNWKGIEQAGNWKVKVAWNAVNGDGGVNRDGARFTIAPEPVSAILFLLGGAGLVTRKLTIRKKSKA
jgi:hypothetical protein